LSTMQVEPTQSQNDRPFCEERNLSRDELIERHLPLVRTLAGRYAGRGEQLDDLVQIGSVGLIKAIDRFDAMYGVPLTSYAIPTILGEIRRHFRDYMWAVSVPRRVKETSTAISSWLDELTAALGRSPTMRELSAAAGFDEEEVLEALEARHTKTLAASTADQDEEIGVTPIETLGTTDDRYQSTEDRIALASGWNVLDERESLVLQRRFFEDWTQTQIALELGISQMHVSRLIRRALDKLREEIESSQ
jgi:RNA polymerase sigma-B factor